MATLPDFTIRAANLILTCQVRCFLDLCVNPSAPPAPSTYTISIATPHSLPHNE